MLKVFLKQYRKTAWVLSALLIYTLAGFFLAPWLVKKEAIEILYEEFNSELQVSKLEINPFALSLRVTGLNLNDPEGDSLLKVEDIYLNFQLSSLFNRAWIFDEFLINTPEIFVSRDNEGVFNFTYLLESSTEQVPEGIDAELESGLLPLLIYNLSIVNSKVHLRDEVPATNVITSFGPINIELVEFNTLANRAGQQKVLITTETQGTLSWSGSLGLNPFSSKGHVSVNDSDFPLLSQYIRDDFGLDITQGHADMEFDYSVIGPSEDQTAGFNVAANNIEIVFSDVLANIYANATSDPGDADWELIKLPLLSITGGDLGWSNRTLSIEAISLNNTHVSLLRDEANILNIFKLPALSSKGDSSAGGNESNNAQKEWKVSLANLSVNQLSMNIQDSKVAPETNLAISDLSVNITGLSNEDGAQFPLVSSAVVQSGGRLNLEGQFSLLPAVELDLEVDINDLALAVAQPYLQEMAGLGLEGDFNLSGSVVSNNDELLGFKGDIAIESFLVFEATQNSELGSWKSLTIDTIDLSLENSNLEISELVFDGLYGDVVIDSDARLNLGQVSLSQEDDAVPANFASLEENTGDMRVTIGRVLIQNGAADFADFSLPLPFSAKITALNGDISTISTASNEPAEINLEGGVDEFGLVKINGSVSPLNLNSRTDLTVNFQNVDIPKFSAYMIPFAGREISSGKLDLMLGYKVTENQLDSDNNLVLRDFSLGERIDHDGAASLPLDLAVALLKNTEGNIDIDLPVSGDVTNPEFSYGGVVMQVFSNLIIKIVASPFALLGNLVGFEGDELEYIEFADGSERLTPPQLEKIDKLAEALSLRPGIILELSGVVDPQADGQALKKSKFETLLESRIEELNVSDTEEGMYAPQKKIVLENLFLEFSEKDESTLSLDAIRARFTSLSEREEEAPVERFDELAYVNELSRHLLNLQTITKAELDALAVARAMNTRVALLDSGEQLMGRISILDNEEIEKNSNEAIRMAVHIGQL